MPGVLLPGLVQMTQSIVFIEKNGKIGVAIAEFSAIFGGRRKWPCNPRLPCLLNGYGQTYWGSRPV
jgi:hypothetical protein